MWCKIIEHAVDIPDSGPYGIAPGKDGAMWFTQQKGNHIGRIDPAGVKIVSYSSASRRYGVMSIISDWMGDIWFTEYHAGTIGRINAEGRLRNMICLPAKPLPSFSTKF